MSDDSKDYFNEPTMEPEEPPKRKKAKKKKAKKKAKRKTYAELRKSRYGVNRK